MAFHRPVPVFHCLYEFLMVDDRVRGGGAGDHHVRSSDIMWQVCHPHCLAANFFCKDLRPVDTCGSLRTWQ